LIHWPGASGLQPGDPKNKKQRLLTWKILTKLKKEGHLRSTGVSNFLVKHLEELVDDPEYESPAVNQVNHYFNPKDLILILRILFFNPRFKLNP